MRLRGITDLRGATLRNCHLMGIRGAVVRTATLIQCTLSGLTVESCMLMGCNLTDTCVLGAAVAVTEARHTHCWPYGASGYFPSAPCPEDDFPMDLGPADNIAQIAAAARWSRSTPRTAVQNSFGTSIETMDSPMNTSQMRMMSHFDTSGGAERTERRVYASHMLPFSTFGRPPDRRGRAQPQHGWGAPRLDA